jgi:hypothetical protein
MEADAARRQQAGLQEQRLEVETGLAGQSIEAQRREADAARAQQAMLAGSRFGTEAGMQTQRLEQQAAIESASNALQSAMADQRSALAAGNQGAALEAQRRAQAARLQVDIASQTQRLGAGAAEQQAALEATRRGTLSKMGLQAGGMGLEAQGRFRQQQLAAGRQLADIGGLTQGATFGAAQQLGQMGAAQEQARRVQMAFDYEQWLRGQEGPGEALAFSQAFMPGGVQQQWQRKPSRGGQILGGLLGLGGLGVEALRAVKYKG